MKGLIIFFGLITFTSNAQNVKSSGIPKVVREASFCIAYEIRDADKREERLLPPDKDDPFADPSNKDTPYIPHGSILISRGHLDFASLISRTIKQKKLTKEQQSSLNSATFQPKATYPPMACHDPHHIFLFYNELGMPLACIEVCFSCNTIKFADNLLNPPKLRKPDSKSDPWEESPKQDEWRTINLNGDMLAIARLCQELGLSLGKYKTFEDYQKKRKPIKAE